MRKITAIALMMCGVCIAYPVIIVAGAELTVYHNDVAVVTDTRIFRIQQGLDTITFADVPTHLEPTSISTYPASTRDGVHTLRSRFMLEEENTGDSLPGPATDSAGRVTIATMADSSTDVEYTARYLTRNINWRAEYTVIEHDDTTVSFAGWVSVENKSGTAFQDAMLKLVAADAFVPSGHTSFRGAPLPATVRNVAAENIQKVVHNAMDERTLDEHTMFAINQPVSLPNNEITLIPLFAPQELSLSKSYHIRCESDRHQHRYPHLHAQVYVYLEGGNSPDYGIGRYIPKGGIRVLKEDQDGAPEVLSQSDLGPIVTGERIEIPLGVTSEITVDRTILERNNLDGREREEKIRYIVRNLKDHAVTAYVHEPLHGHDWTLKTNGYDYDPVDVREVIIPIAIDPQDEKELRVTIRYH